MTMKALTLCGSGTAPGWLGCATPAPDGRVPCNAGAVCGRLHVNVSGSTCTGLGAGHRHHIEGSPTTYSGKSTTIRMRLGYKFPDGTGGVFFKSPTRHRAAAGSVFDSPERLNDKNSGARQEHG